MAHLRHSLVVARAAQLSGSGTVEQAYPQLFSGATVKRRRSGQRGTAPRLQDTVRLSAEGVAKVLGDLEARVMHAVWSFGRPVPARAVHELVYEQHDVALLTVITVLNKLVHKGLLRRAKKEALLHYEALLTEDQFMAHASRRVVEGVLALDPDVVASSFVDVLAEQDPARLAELGRLIRRKLREQQ